MKVRSEILGVPVGAELQKRWQQWLAPSIQPFFVDSLSHWPKSSLVESILSPEHNDTYRGWRVDRSLKVLWLDEEAFLGMPASRRARLIRAQVENRRGAVPSVRRWADALDPATLRSQADGHRFVWWPSLLGTNPLDILSRVVSAGPDGSEVQSLPSRHSDVAGATWNRCKLVLPGARRTAGSFPGSSGPNCFGAVMAAAGAGGTGDQQTQTRFLEWLDSVSRPGGGYDEPGTVLVWRDDSGSPVHAAVTVGDGWIVEKASQEWWTPFAVRTVRDVIQRTRTRGQRLERHRIVKASISG